MCSSGLIVSCVPEWSNAQTKVWTKFLTVFPTTPAISSS